MGTTETEKNDEAQLTPQEQELLDGEAAAAGGPIVEEQPDWVIMPAGFKFPGNGKKVFFIKIEAALTDTPALGDRQAILWNLTVKDERIARARADGVQSRVYDELAMMMVRAIDGAAVPPDSKLTLAKFWDDIGPKYRGMLVNWYMKTHHFTDEERLHFFGHCVASRTAT